MRKVSTSPDTAAGGYTTAWGQPCAAVAKGIAGGVPAGALLVGGELLDVVASGDLPHYSTYAGAPLACRAGIATLNDVLTGDAYDALERLSERLCACVCQSLQTHGIAGQGGVRRRQGHDAVRRRRAASRLPRLRLQRRPRPDRLHWLWLADRGILVSPGSDE